MYVLYLLFVSYNGYFSHYFKKKDIPNKAKYQDEASPFIGNLTTDFMKETLTTFTGFRNRYYKSSYGAKSCRWLIQQIRDVAEGTNHVSVKEFEHSVSSSINGYTVTAYLFSFFN
jgi:hypothetical protein